MTQDAQNVPPPEHGAPRRVWSHDSIRAWWTQARDSILYGRIGATQEFQWVNPNDRRTAREKADDLMRTAGKIGPWGAAVSMEVVLGAFVQAVVVDEAPVVLLAGFRGISNTGEHGKARGIIQAHAEEKWRAHVQAGGKQFRTLFLANEVRVHVVQRQIYGTLHKDLEASGTVDYAAVRIDDALLWSVVCLAEAEMSTKKNEAVKDFKRLLRPKVPFRLFICRASWETERGGGRPSDEVLRDTLAGLVRDDDSLEASDELAVLMFITGRGNQRPPWGGIYETTGEGKQLSWRQIGA